MTDGHNVTPWTVDTCQSDRGAAQAEDVKRLAGRLGELAGLLATKPRSPSEFRPLVRALEAAIGAIERLF